MIESRRDTIARVAGITGKRSGSCARKNFALRSFASAAFRSPSTCMASARRSSSWCAPRARCTPSRIAPGARSATFFDGFDGSDPEYDTEEVYFELLREIGRTRRTARDRRHHRGRLGRRHQRHHAGARLEPRSADGGAARAVARRMPTSTSCCRREARAGGGASGSCSRCLWAAGATGRFRTDHRHGGAAKTVAVRALALVPAAARRPRDGGPDV